MDFDSDLVFGGRCQRDDLHRNDHCLYSGVGRKRLRVLPRNNLALPVAAGRQQQAAVKNGASAIGPGSGFWPVAIARHAG